MCDLKAPVVLVIDDCEDNLVLMELILTNNGYQVETACCGKEGISKTYELVPHLIFLDMMMPDMSGLDVLHSIKADRHLSQIPIIICTANRYITKDDVIGVEKICYKPFDINDILILANSLIDCCQSVDGVIVVMDVNDKDSLRI